MSFRERPRGRERARASLLGERAPRLESAPRELLCRDWRSPEDLRQRTAISSVLKRRKTLQKRPRVGMSRVVEGVCGRAGFDQASVIHDGHAIGQTRDHGKIVTDQEQGQMVPVGHFPQ